MYTPKIIDEKNHYAEMLVEFHVCPICLKYMMPRIEGSYSVWGKNIFPNYWAINYESQLKNAGWVFQSDIEVDDKYICIECVQSDKADFLCALCNQRKPTSKARESFGDPPEYLCTDCYETVTVSAWEEKQSELGAAHRWDYE